MTTYEVIVKGVTLKMYLKEEADASIAELKGALDEINSINESDAVSAILQRYMKGDHP